MRTKMIFVFFAINILFTFVECKITANKIWRVFNATDSDNNTVIEYQIRTIPSHLYEKAANMMVKHFLTDEPMSRARGIYALFF